MAEPIRISPEEAAKKIQPGQQKTLLVCAYENEDKARAFRLQGAITLQELQARQESIPDDVELIFYCACPEDETATARAREWQEEGFPRTKVLAGGVEGWKAAGFDMAQPAPKETLDHTPEPAPIGPKPDVPTGAEPLPPRHGLHEARPRSGAGAKAGAGAGGTMKARDLMTKTPEVIAADGLIDEAARRMRDLDVGALPVCDANRRFIGMITDRDIAVRVIAEGRDPRRTRIVEAMSGDLVTCDEDADVVAVARLMQERHVRRVPIMRKSATGGEGAQDLVGIISLDDLATDLRVSDVVARTLAGTSGG